MTLLGNANWWAPAPLRRLHQRIGLREAPALAAAPADAASAVRLIDAPPNSPSRQLVGAGTGGRNAE
jgi:RND superfamily putative drug exporter